MHASLLRLYPEAVIEKVEGFYDVPGLGYFYRLHFHIGSGQSQIIYLDENGELYTVPL